MFGRIERWMSKSTWPFYMAILGFALTLPGLMGGFSADDFILKSAFFDGHFKTDNTIFGMFSFASGDPTINRELMDTGFLPWWSNPDLLVNFWRPLSELSHAIDFALWPDQPVLMHLHNSLWYFLLILVTARGYVALTKNTRAAGIAAFLFAVTVLHANSVGWIANRNALIAGVLGVLCVLAHHRWRDRGERNFAVLAAVTFTLSLLSAEAGLATTAYLFSYMLFIERSRAMQARVLSLAPYAIIVVLWKLSYDTLGFGSFGSGAYINPTGDFSLFGIAVVERAPILLLAQVFGQPAGLHIFAPTDIQGLLWLFAIGALAILSVVLLPLVVRLPAGRFYLVGMLLAVLPVCAGNIDERSLIFVSVGGFGMLGLIFDRWLSRNEKESTVTTLQSGLIVALAVPHVLLAPLMLLSSVNSLAMFTQTFTKPAIELPIKGEVKEAVVFLVNPPTPQLNMHFPAIRLHHKLEQPNALYTLAPGSTELTITRQGNHLIIDAEDGYIHHYDSLFRGDAMPLATGDMVELASMKVEVLSVTEDQRPKSVAFKFNKDLEGGNMQFMIWQGAGYSAFDVPEQGSAVKLEAISPIDVVLKNLGV